MTAFSLCARKHEVTTDSQNNFISSKNRLVCQVLHNENRIKFKYLNSDKYKIDVKKNIWIKYETLTLFEIHFTQFDKKGYFFWNLHPIFIQEKSVVFHDSIGIKIVWNSKKVRKKLDSILLKVQYKRIFS